jgi:hypothetical protein
MLACTVVLGASLTGAGAADVTFEPTLDFNVFYDGNTQGVGETNDPNADDPSAIVGGIGLTLPWTVRTPSTGFAFSYSPRHEIYNDEQRPDFTSHRVNGSVSRTVSPRASYSLNLDYNRSDRQELDPLRPSDAITYTVRRTFDSGGLNGAGTFSAGRRSSINWRAGARFNHGEDLEGSSFEDSESYDAAFGWALNYSPQGSAGLAVLAQHFTYESLSSVDVVSIGHTGTRRFSREGSLNYAVGVLRSDDAGDTNVSGSLNLGASWTLGQYATISTGARQGASAGDGISGASLDRGGYVSWSYARPRGFNASISGAFWDRQNLNDASTAPDPPSAFTLSDSFSWRIGRFFRLGVFHSYYDQSASSGADAGLETSYHTGGLSGTWILRGERRAGA